VEAAVLFCKLFVLVGVSQSRAPQLLLRLARKRQLHQRLNLTCSFCTRKKLRCSVIMDSMFIAEIGFRSIHFVGEAAALILAHLSRVFSGTTIKPLSFFGRPTREE